MLTIRTNGVMTARFTGQLEQSLMVSIATGNIPLVNGIVQEDSVLDLPHGLKLFFWANDTTIKSQLDQPSH